MDIEPYGRGVFLVHVHGDTFTVDTLCNDGSGGCDCIHFLGHIKPAIEDARADKSFVPGRKYKCPHILAADDFLLSLFKRELRRQFPDTKNEP